MIASVSGTVAALGPDSAVIEVGGIGVRLMCTPSTLADLRVGARAALATTLVVREDSLTVYGFADDDERTVFELLQTASGIGPRLALAALAVLSADELRTAVATEDVETLCRIPGVGPKGARKIVLELKDRLGPAVGSLPAVVVGDDRRAALLQALQSLGWSSREAAAAADVALSDAPAGQPLAELLRAALRGMQRA